MKYSIEIGKIVEGALKHDQTKILNYTKQLISKLENDGETRAVVKFTKLLESQSEMTLSAMGMSKDFLVPVDSESRTVLADVIYPRDNNTSVILSMFLNNTQKVFVGMFGFHISLCILVNPDKTNVIIIIGQVRFDILKIADMNRYIFTIHVPVCVNHTSFAG